MQTEPISKITNEKKDKANKKRICLKWMSAYLKAKYSGTSI